MNTVSTKAKLKDVAGLAGVSLTSAAKVLNGGSDGIRVSQKVQEKIHEAAAQLGYRKNVMASALRGGNSGLIGIIMDAWVHYRGAAILRGIEYAAAERGFRIITSSTHNNIESIHENFAVFRQYGTAGIICFSHDYPGMEKKLGSIFAKQPNVVFLEKPRFETSSYVESSNRQAMTELFADLARQGKKRIGLMRGELCWQYNIHLLADFRFALRENGVEFMPELVFELPTGEDISKRCAMVADECEKYRPDVIFSDDAERGVALQCILQLRGWKIPADIRIFGGDNDPFFRYAAPAIPSFDPQYDRIAGALVNSLLASGEVKPVTIESVYNQPLQEQ